MSDLTPTNDLDRAIMALQRSQSALPDLCRHLATGELWFLVPYHPEVEGEVIEFGNGSSVPFAMLEDSEGVLVPIFSSEARLEQGLERAGIPARTYSAGSLPALQLLEILGNGELRAILNKSCTTGELLLPCDLMRDLANGSALEPLPVGQATQQTVEILDAADYPTDLIQPAFEFMRRHGNFRAAWIFSRTRNNEQPDQACGYQLLLLMKPKDEAILHDLNVTVQSARQNPDDIAVALLDENDVAYVKELFRQAAPFYIAADYQRPQE